MVLVSWVKVYFLAGPAEVEQSQQTAVVAGERQITCTVLPALEEREDLAGQVPHLSRVGLRKRFRRGMALQRREKLCIFAPDVFDDQPAYLTQPRAAGFLTEAEVANFIEQLPHPDVLVAQEVSERLHVGDSVRGTRSVGGEDRSGH